MIKLDENYSITASTKSYVLVFAEQREKVSKKTGEKEPYTFKDYWHFPRLGQCIEKYRNLKQQDLITLKEAIEIDKQLVSKIDEIKKIIFKQ